MYFLSTNSCNFKLHILKFCGELKKIQIFELQTKKLVKMSDDEDFLDVNDENQASHNSSIGSHRRLVLRNPSFKTPGPASSSRQKDKTPTKILNRNQNPQQKCVLAPLVTATPIRGPKRFMKVVNPVVSPGKKI